MQQIWLTQEAGNQDLIIYMLGWAATPNAILHIDTPGFDVLACCNPNPRAAIKAFHTEYMAADYKSSFIARESGLVGLMVNERASRDGSRYILLCFDGYKLVEVVNEKYIAYLQPDFARATIVDNYLYIMASYSFKTIKLFD